jgi:curved DNA-binding protein CbpA
MRGEPDPYQALGLGADASTADISRAYRRLARVLHPDSQPGDAGTADQFRAVSDAYELLSDPARRADWDRRHLRQASSPRRAPGRSAPSQGSAGPQIWPPSPTAANPPPPHPALWAGPVYVEPAPGAGTAGLARPQPGHGDLAWILERLLAGPWDLRW